MGSLKQVAGMELALRKATQTEVHASVRGRSKVISALVVIGLIAFGYIFPHQTPPPEPGFAVFVYLVLGFFVVCFLIPVFYSQTLSARTATGRIQITHGLFRKRVWSIPLFDVESIYVDERIIEHPDGPA